MIDVTLGAVVYRAIPNGMESMIGGHVSRPMDKLMELQKVDSKIMRCNQECEDIPARKKQIEESTSHLKQSVEDAKEALKESQAKVHEREVSADSERETIKKLRSQQLLLKTNKEFKAMEEEILTVERKIAAIEDAEIELMEGVERCRSGVKAAEQALSEAEDQSKLDQVRMDKRLDELKEQLVELQKERDVAKEGVRPQWLQDYERRLGGRSKQAVASVEHGVCSSCNMKLSPQIVHTARAGDTLVSCSFCGVFLC